MMLNGREIDTTCPDMSQCWGNGYCPETCPDTLFDVLKKSAVLEHVLEMTPHTDPDLQTVCSLCGVTAKDSNGRYINILTLNEARDMKRGESDPG